MPRRRRKKRYVVNIRRLTLSVLLLLLLGETVMAAFTSPCFYVRRTLIAGNRLVKAAEISERAKLSKDANIFLINARSIKRRVMRNPIVQDVQVYRRLPGTMIVRVTERKPDLVLDTGGKFYEVDGSGIPYRAVSRPDSGLTVISCDPPKRMVLGKPLTDSDFKSARDCLLMVRSKKSFDVAKLSVDQSRDMCLNVGDGYQVRLGRPEQLSEKLDIAVRAVQQVPDFRQHGDYIDVTCPEAPAVKLQDGFDK